MATLLSRRLPRHTRVHNTWLATTEKGGVYGFHGQAVRRIKRISPAPLNKDDPAAQKLDAMRQPVEKLVAEIKDPIEVVPGNETAFFFIGKPPKKFGVAWVGKDGNIVNFKSLVEEKGLSIISLEKLSDRLKAVYIQHQEEPRYSAMINDKQVVVTPSETLKSDIQKVIADTVS